MVNLCWKPSVVDDEKYGAVGSAGMVDELLWHKDLGSHVYGEYSMAVVQANSLVEDHSQLESGSNGIFVGVYDGHGGPEASRFVADNLYTNLKKLAFEHKGGISANAIRKAFSKTEEDFLSIVNRKWLTMPQIASAGSCCLTGIISKGVLYIANAGDSRAVLGKVHKTTRDVHAIQLSTEHNANIEEARVELRLLHPNDPYILVQKHKVWRVKGIIQITKSIGDAYLKRSEFNRAPLAPKFRFHESFDKPIINSDPSIYLHKIQPEDQFVIFASDGLWELISNQEAVRIVHAHPHNGAARRLVEAALREAARKREMRYGDLKRIERGVRRHFHDDITVVVVFLDSHLINKKTPSRDSLSVRGGGGQPSIVHLGSAENGRQEMFSCGC